MASQEVHVEEVKNKKDLISFIQLPWAIYRGDRYWVPPLIKDQLYKLSPDHPFHSHAEMALFLAYREDKVVGRIAGIIDHHYIEFHQEKVGFFGFFESMEELEIAESLFSKVKEWLKGKGMQKALGPMNPSTNDECGLLIEGWQSSPCLMMPYNPPYYCSFIENLGWKKAMDLYAYLVEKSTLVDKRLLRIKELVKKREPNLWIRPIRLNEMEEELKIIKGIYNQAWSRNWGFVPMTEEEIDDLAKILIPLVIPDLVLFVYLKEEPIGFSVALPDYNQVLKHLNGKIGLIGGMKYLYYRRKIKTIRMMLLGIKQGFQKKGAEGLLYAETVKNGLQKGFESAECSWILENNHLMQHGIESLGGRRYKTYRIYESPL